MNYNVQLFDDYLLQKMTPPEKRAFEDKLASDPYLRAAFETHKRLVGAVQEDGRNALRDRISNVHKDWEERSRKQVGVKRTAGVLVGLLVLSLSIYYNFTGRRSPGEWFDVFYTPYALPGRIRGAPSPTSDLQEFYQSYREGAFERAIAVFPDERAAQIIDPQVWMAYGSALMSVGDFARAEQYFQLPVITGNAFTADQGKWYRALCLLQLGDRETCAAVLKTLAEDPFADFHKEARSLLKQMKRLSNK